MCSSFCRSPASKLLTGMPVARATTSAICSAPTWLGPGLGLGSGFGLGLGLGLKLGLGLGSVLSGKELGELRRL